MPLLPYLNENQLEAGVDEAGRGTLIGDVFAAAVIWPPELSEETVGYHLEELNDSKKISRRRRLILRDYIEENAVDFAVGSASAETVDKINILQASLESMHIALDKLNVRPDFILVDGDNFKIYREPISWRLIPHYCIVDGDATYQSIAAASILAKVYHDEYIEKLCENNPELEERYHLRNNMGYGTKAHLDGIAQYGISKYHRKTFGICRRFADTRNDNQSN